MPSFGGLISGLMGGIAQGTSHIADLEMKKQQELDLQSQLLKAKEDMQLRIDEVTRGRDIRDIGLRSDAETTAYERNAPKKAETDAKVAPIKAVGEAKGQIAKVATPGYTDALSKEDYAKSSGERSVATISTGPANAKNAREQQAWDESVKAREWTAKYLTAYEAGDMQAAKEARLQAVKLGVDPAASRKGSLKVSEDDSGNKVLVHEDSQGNVTRVDPNTLEPYRGKGPGAGQAAGPKEGDKGTSKSGKPIVYRNGNWEYQ